MSRSTYNPFSLEGKTILVTGASSGIGRATAVECSKMGATVILSARNQEKLNETLSMMEGEGHNIVTADLSEEDDIRNLAKNCPKLDGVVSVAGMACLKPLKYYSKSAVEDVFAVNTFAGMYLIRELLREKKISDGGSLVFISSIASSFSPSSANGIYSASKAAIEAFSRQCALELANVGIRSNAILPGLTRTKLIEYSPLISEEDSHMASALLKSEEKLSLLKRFGLPEEISWCAVYLLSDASAFVTGASFVIDGGLHLI